jgi:hypothetical protein
MSRHSGRSFARFSALQGPDSIRERGLLLCALSLCAGPGTLPSRGFGRQAAAPTWRDAVRLLGEAIGR